jgi:hypothetical protein
VRPIEPGGRPTQRHINLNDLLPVSAFHRPDKHDWMK